MNPDEIAALEQQLSDPERRAEAASALAEVHRRAGRHDKLAQALETLAITTREPRAEARVLAELGRARLALRDAEQALLAFGRAFYLAPEDRDLLAGARSVAEPAMLVDVLEDLLSDAPAAARPCIEQELAALR